MKETKLHEADKIQVHAQKEVEKKTVKIGESILRPGHTCFEINIHTLECEIAKYQPSAIFNGGVRSKVIIKKSCVYVNALNKKNALKVYKRDFIGMVRVLNKPNDYSDISFF